MKCHKWILFAVPLAIALSACEAREPGLALEAIAPLEQIDEILDETTGTPSSQTFEDVVELVSLKGSSTTVYKLEDGRYLNHEGQYFTFDGMDTWTCDDGSFWSRKLDTPVTRVLAEFAVERFLAQRPDYLFCSDGSENASKVVLTFDTDVTQFRFLRLNGTFDSTGAFHCSETQELYSEAKITTTDLMVVEANLDGLIPTRGISFVDPEGITRYYYLALSGEDNAPLLVSFK